MKKKKLIEILPGRFAKQYIVTNHINDIDDLKKSPHTPEKPLYGTKQRGVPQALMDKWSTRSNIKNLNQLTFDTPVILCNWTGEFVEILNRLEAVYQVIDNNTTKIYTGSINQFMHVNTRVDLEPCSHKTYLFYGDFVNRKKVIQRHWKYKDDIRSFKTLDESYYGHDNKNSIITAAVNFASTRYKNTDHKPVIFNLKIEDISPKDQIALRHNNIICI